MFIIMVGLKLLIPVTILISQTTATSPVDIFKFHPDDIQYIKESFTVSSPDYPDPYHMYNSFDCIMDLTAVGGFYFQITFLDFQVSSKEKLPKRVKSHLNSDKFQFNLSVPGIRGCHDNTIINALK